MSIPGLDTDLLGERLASVVEKYGQMQESVRVADRAQEAARKRASDAKAEDLDALARAHLSGETVTADAERRAQDAFAEAKRTALAAQRAELLAREDVLRDVREHKADYEEVIANEAKTVEQAALEALDEFETHARRLAELRAHQVWLQRPARGEWPITGPRVVVDDVSPVVAGARKIVTGDRPKSTQNDWGIPAGIVPKDGMAYTLRKSFDHRTGLGGPEDADAHRLQAPGAGVQNRLMQELADNDE